MSRWAPDAAIRLESAARQLFAEQGYAATTVPQIAARAGLTTRSFFRYFADKREVLFLREREFPALVQQSVSSAPPGLSVGQLLDFGYRDVIEGFDHWREDLLVRRSIIQSDDGLIERELLKSRMLAKAIESAIDGYGLSGENVTFEVAVSVFVFDRAVERWLNQTNPEPLRNSVQLTREMLVQVASGESDRGGPVPVRPDFPVV